MTGTSGRKRVPKGALLSLPIPLPPLPEQKRIVEILSLAEDLIKKQKEAIALIDKILMAKFLEMFGDPATNPKGWEVRRLGEVTEVLSESIAPANHSNEKFWLYSFEAYDTSKQPELKPGEEIQSNKIVLTKDCILFARLNPRKGRIWKVKIKKDHKNIASTEFVPFSPKPDMNLDYLYWVLKAKILPEAQENISGTTKSRERVSKNFLSNLSIPLPPIELQKEFAQIIEEFEKKREEMQRTLEILESLFKLLQKKAFTGELTAEWREQNNVEWEIPQITERQAVLLATIYYHQNIVEKPAMVTVAMKSAFLLQQEAGLNLGYDFIPYKYGPFSKEVYEDIEELEKNLLVERVKPKKDIEMTEIRLIEEFKDWTEKIIDSLPEDIKEIVKAYIEKYGKMELNELLDYVYAKYPEYATKSKRKREK